MILTLRSSQSGWSPVPAATPPTRGQEGVGRPAGRSGAAPYGVKVQAGGDGGEGAGRSVGRGAPRSEGSSGRRRRERGPADRSGAASRGAEVQTGGEGGGGDRLVGRARRLAECRFRRAARAAGRSPAPARGPYPLCLVCGGGRAGVGVPCAPREHPDYIYQRVVAPEGPTTPSSVTQSGQTEPSGRTKAAFRPRPCSSRVSAPCFAALRAPRTPDRRPDQGDSGLLGPVPGRDARPGITGVLSRCAGRPSSPSPCVFTQVGEGQRFRRRPPSAPGRRGHGEPAAPTAPPCSAAPD